MNKVEIELAKKQLTDADLDYFEKEYNKKLPQNFRKYLLKYNGGLVENRDDLDILLSLLEGNKIEHWVRSHQILEQNIDPDYLPFANDHTNNPYCLILKEGDDYGKVVFIEMDFQSDEYIVADSLEEFLGVESIDDL
ncbi:MAG: SMI1/KNR4 family protein [Flavobacteriales bacterium]|nr:SMI1/KNR4 family protein [Flavobacteriales bacterium]